MGRRTRATQLSARRDPPPIVSSSAANNGSAGRRGSFSIATSAS
jgi:hypothetical protein